MTEQTTSTSSGGKDVEVKLTDVRLSFFHGFTPQERRDDKTKEINGYSYNCAVLIPKDRTDLVTAIKAAMAQAKKNTWGDNAPRLAADKLCLRDGEPAEEEGGPRVPLYEGYAGCFYLSGTRPVSIEVYEQIKKGTKPRPVKIIGPRKETDPNSPFNGKFKPLNEGDEFAPYSGCYANVIVRIYGYPGGEGIPARIIASLEAVQFKRHGEAFGARSVDVDNAFDEEEVDDDTVGTSGGAATAVKGGDDFDIG